jgi:hypothetical protein
MIRRFALAVLLVVAPAVSAPASAQESVGDIISFLVTNQAVQTGDFERDQAAAEAARDAITRALLLNLGSVPLASSSSGFLYRLNPQLGTMERVTESFGAFFVERALGPGAGRASFGATVSTSSFDRLGDLRLEDGSLVTVFNQFQDETAPFDTESLTLRMQSRTLTLFGSVGVTDRFEIGGALPLVELTVDGQRLNVYRGTETLQASGEASASGVGDLALRAKYTLVSGTSGAVAAAGEIRLPTGDDVNLLGAGTTSYRVIGIGSFEQGRFALHGNGGLVFGGISDEVNVSGAAGVAVAPRFTLSGEVLFRRIAELADLALVSEPHPTIVGVETGRLLAGERGAWVGNAVAGFKWNPGGSVVVGGHLAFPLVRRGLTAPVTPTLTFEYAF